ncbi:thiamine pyrophosphate-binding protein [Elioraea sp.]|uniref:thiamine pyrophosphate-binding protein n=1 Tax=Elioraea sp. TaxID=2185103 RepID=UPI0025BFEB95|nr:thiamine pyrophosphate-dependent enzyme [Elioraea sp.]
MDSPASRAGLAATAADALAEGLLGLGVTRLFGMPGGGSSLDLIAASHRAGLPFTLARTETGAAIMASAHAEVTGRPGALLVTRGPGVASAANGIAHADLDRAPVLLVTDGFTAAQTSYVTHQRFDQMALMAPIVRAQRATTGSDITGCLEALAAAMLGPCAGPAVLELTDEAAKRPPGDGAVLLPAPLAPADAASLTAARALLAAARRPVIIAGLEARDAATPLRALATSLGAPVLVTYKAKGVVPDDDPLLGGIFTGGAAEAPLVSDADLILLAGLDPVELIPQPWRYGASVIDIARFARPLHYLTPACLVVGDVAHALTALAGAAGPSAWDRAAIGAARSRVLAALAAPGAGDAVGPERVVTLAQEACGRAGLHPRVTVDAGAHMFSATGFWRAEAPNDLLISNGLATMGYALPAAIGAALAEPGRRTLAFTGDGGLAMCLGELATAAAEALPVTVIVFNDAALSLIDLKKAGRTLPGSSLGYAAPDFAAIARGLGCRGETVADVAGYRAALGAALATPGPTVIDVRIDASGYAAQLAAARG